jgi:Sulfatase
MSNDAEVHRPPPNRGIRQFRRRPSDAPVDRRGFRSFCLYVHHTDADREWAYDRHPPSAAWTKASTKRRSAAGQYGHEERLGKHLWAEKQMRLKCAQTTATSLSVSRKGNKEWGDKNDEPICKRALITVAIFGAAMSASAQSKKPNIVVIFGDDVGVWNISAYHRGMMGGSTPNIDRIAKEGALFTDYYAQQSCTVGRAAFIMGQTPFRTGLLKVGLPGAKQGIQDKDPTIAELLKTQGYATARSARIISATAMNSCRRCTASTSSTATYTTSIPKRSRRTPTIRKTPHSTRSLDRAEYWSARPATRTTRRTTRASVKSANKPARTPVP